MGNLARKKLKVCLDDSEYDWERLARTATKLTPEITEKFQELARKGLPSSTICQYLSIGDRTFHNWLRKGRAYLDGAAGKKWAKYGAFVNLHRRAGAEFQEECLDLFRSADKDFSYRNMVILERRDRKNWGKTEPVGGGEESYDPDDRFL